MLAAVSLKQIATNKFSKLPSDVIRKSVELLEFVNIERTQKDSRCYFQTLFG